MKLRDFVRGPLARSAAWGLVLALAAGLPAPVLAAPAEPVGGPAPAAAPALTVMSQPTGATVYVDGEFKGETPVAVDSVKPGDHRVRVVKDGYLENSRVVAVPSSKGSEVNVQLTPFAGTPRPSYQVEPGGSSGGGGGGGKKALLIGLGVVAVGAGIYFATKSSNKAPTVGGVSADPTVALQSATSVTFNAQASDPDGDSLTYSWEFGDGGTATGVSPTHTYTSTGSFPVSVTVSDGKKSATGNTNVTVVSATGSWSGSISASGFNISFTASLTQSGSSLSGSFRLSGFPTASISGSVSAPNRMTMRISIPGFLPFNMPGTFESGFNRVNGTVSSSDFGANGTWTMSR